MEKNILGKKRSLDEELHVSPRINLSKRSKKDISRLKAHHAFAKSQKRPPKFLSQRQLDNIVNHIKVPQRKRVYQEEYTQNKYCRYDSSSPSTSKRHSPDDLTRYGSPVHDYKHRSLCHSRHKSPYCSRSRSPSYFSKHNISPDRECKHSSKHHKRYFCSPIKQSRGKNIRLASSSGFHSSQERSSTPKRRESWDKSCYRHKKYRDYSSEDSSSSLSGMSVSSLDNSVEEGEIMPKQLAKSTMPKVGRKQVDNEKKKKMVKTKAADTLLEDTEKKGSVEFNVRDKATKSKDLSNETLSNIFNKDEEERLASIFKSVEHCKVLNEIFSSFETTSTDASHIDTTDPLPIPVVNVGATSTSPFVTVETKTARRAATLRTITLSDHSLSVVARNVDDGNVKQTVYSRESAEPPLEENSSELKKKEAVEFVNVISSEHSNALIEKFKKMQYEKYLAEQKMNNANTDLHEMRELMCKTFGKAGNVFKHLMYTKCEDLLNICMGSLRLYENDSRQLDEDLRQFVADLPPELQVEISNIKAENYKEDSHSAERYVCYDSGDHLCYLCNEQFTSISSIVEHFQSSEHAENFNRGKKKEQKQQGERTVHHSSKGEFFQSVKGVEFLKHVPIFFCTLCKETFQSVRAEEHVKSHDHFMNYKSFIKKNPLYEQKCLFKRYIYFFYQTQKMKGVNEEKQKSAEREVAEENNMNNIQKLEVDSDSKPKPRKKSNFCKIAFEKGSKTEKSIAVEKKNNEVSNNGNIVKDISSNENPNELSIGDSNELCIEDSNELSKKQTNNESVLYGEKFHEFVEMETVYQGVETCDHTVITRSLADDSLAKCNSKENIKATTTDNAELLTDSEKTFNISSAEEQYSNKSTELSILEQCEEVQDPNICDAMDIKYQTTCIHPENEETVVVKDHNICDNIDVEEQKTCIKIEDKETVVIQDHNICENGDEDQKTRIKIDDEASVEQLPSNTCSDLNETNAVDTTNLENNSCTVLNIETLSIAERCGVKERNIEKTLDLNNYEQEIQQSIEICDNAAIEKASTDYCLANNNSDEIIEGLITDNVTASDASISSSVAEQQHTEGSSELPILEQCQDVEDRSESLEAENPQNCLIIGADEASSERLLSDNPSDSCLDEIDSYFEEIKNVVTFLTNRTSVGVSYKSEGGSQIICSPVDAIEGDKKYSKILIDKNIDNSSSDNEDSDELPEEQILSEDILSEDRRFEIVYESGASNASSDIPVFNAKSAIPETGNIYSEDSILCEKRIPNAGQNILSEAKSLFIQTEDLSEDTRIEDLSPIVDSDENINLQMEGEKPERFKKKFYEDDSEDDKGSTDNSEKDSVIISEDDEIY